MNVDYWVGLGCTFLDTKYAEKALFYFDFAHRIDPTHQGALYYLANFSSLVKIPSGALDADDQILKSKGLVKTGKQRLV